MLIGVSCTVETRFCAVTTISPSVAELSAVEALWALADVANATAELASRSAPIYSLGTTVLAVTPRTALPSRWTIIVAPIIL
jgi:hypothetical protein